MTKKFLTLHFSVLYVIWVLAFVKCAKPENSSITFDEMDYKQFWKICANWSTTSRKTDYSKPYPVLTYTKYAPTINEFLEKYPFVTIETSFRATSDCFDEDQQVPYHSETLTFETRNFLNTKFDYKYAVHRHHNGFSYDVGAEVGFGFRCEDNVFYLQAFINGWVYKGGAFWSCLEFGLGATSITFHSKHPNDV